MKGLLLMSCFSLIGLKNVAYLYNTVRSTILLMKHTISAADARGEVNLRIMPMLLNNHSKEMRFKRRRRSMFLNFNLSDTSSQGNTSVC